MTTGKALDKTYAISLAFALWSTSLFAGAVPEAFQNWPNGLDPQTIGGKVVAQFMSTEPESYNPKGFSAGPFGGGKYVPYAVASLWVNAMEYSLLTSQRNLKIKLCERFDPFLPKRAKADKVTKPRHVDFNVFGAVPLEVAVLTGEKRAKAMGLRYADDQWEPPRPEDLDVFPGWLKSHYVAPEQQREYLKNGYSGQTRLWIDDMYMINLLQTQAYRVTTNRQYIVRAAHEMVLYLDKLQLENGLFNHAADVPFRWARGNGWMAAGMPLLLQYLTPRDENYGRILEGYQKMMATLLNYQRPSGLWGQLIDVPESWDETSGSLMFAYAFIQGCRFGWLDAARYAPAARMAYLAIASKLDEYGNVPDVCEGTGAKNDCNYYLARKKINGDPHGQAPLLWCCNALLESDPEIARRAVWDKPPVGGRLSPVHRYDFRCLKDRLLAINSVKEGQFRLTPTYISCSAVWGVQAPVDGIALEYRETDGEWQQAPAPVFFGDALNYRGSILNLREDTEYEARLRAGEKVLAEGRFRTWSSAVPIAKTVVLDPNAVKYPIVITDQGSPDGWIRYTTPKGVVLGGKDVTNSIIRIQGAKYIVLDDLVVEGGGGRIGDLEMETPVYIAESKGVRIRNCEFYGFGHVGHYVYTDAGRGRPYPIDVPQDSKDPGLTANWDAAIMVFPHTEELTIERCYIHDARMRSNSWYHSHPSGTEGIFLYRTGGSIVLRWNDIVGSDHNRWNDAIEGCENFGPAGGFNRDSDIYGNFCIFGNDDCIEIDGGQQNVRVFRNRFESSACCISCQGCMVSPSYVFDNLLFPTCDEIGWSGHPIKTGGYSLLWYSPYTLLYGNTIWHSEYVRKVEPDARWDWRSDNRVVSGIPDSLAAKYPERPVKFMIDRGRVDGVKISGGAAAPEKIEFMVRATEPTPFRIRKNFDNDWFVVEPDAGVLQPGENRFTLAFLPEKMRDYRYWRGAFLIRSPDGLSRVMTVYAERTDYEQPVEPVTGSARTIYAHLERPIVFERGQKAEPVMVTFEVKEPGRYWFQMRGRSLEAPPTDSLCTRLPYRVAIDDDKFKTSTYFFYRDYHVWNMVRPGREAAWMWTGYDPYELKPGRHTLRIKPLVNETGSVEITDFALTDEPVMFEPH